MKTGVDFLIETINKTLKDELEEDFNIDSVKTNIILLRKSEMFCKPIFSKLEFNNGIFHAGWENSINTHLRQKKVQSFNKQYSVNNLFAGFNNEYMLAYKENNEKALENHGLEFKEKFQSFNNEVAIEEKKLISKQVKRKLK